MSSEGKDVESSAFAGLETLACLGGGGGGRELGSRKEGVGGIGGSGLMIHVSFLVCSVTSFTSPLLSLSPFSFSPPTPSSSTSPARVAI